MEFHYAANLFNLTGAMSPKEQDSLEAVDEKILTNTFSVNTFGPLLLTQALLPNLLKSNKRRIGVMSSRVSSIGDNSTSGSYAYRALKAAPNSIFESRAMDINDKNVVVVIMHPGFVKTSLDPSMHALDEAVEPNEAAEKLWEVLMSKRIEETGRFWHREGQELHW